jgi:hypothetical protein
MPTLIPADALFSSDAAALGEWRATVRLVYAGTEGSDEDQAEVLCRIETWDGGRYSATVCPDLDPAYGWEAVLDTL